MEYKQIENFTKYFVCDDGFVYKACSGSVGFKRLGGSWNSVGYSQTCMVENGYKEKHLTHRLVAMYFVPNPDNKPFVDHINGNKKDNSAVNLRWCTHKENMNNPKTKGKHRETQRKRYETPLVFVKNGVEIKFDSQYTAEQYFNCDRQYIMKALKSGETLYGFSISQMEDWEKTH